MTRTRGRTRALVAAATSALCVFLPVGRASAQGAEVIRRYDVLVRIGGGGEVTIRETIDYDFGPFERHGIFRDIPVRVAYDEKYDRVYPLQVLSVTGSPGTPVQYELEDAGGGLERIRIGDPDRTITGPHTYTIDYVLRGTLNGFPDHDELYWNVIGADWSVAIERASVRVEAPGAITDAICFAGPTGSTLPCGKAKVEGDAATFSQKQLLPYEGLTVAVAFPKGLVPAPSPILEERWSLPAAFSVTPVTATVSLLLLALVIGGFSRLAWVTGRDRRYIGSPVDVVMGSRGGAEQQVPLLEEDEAPVEFAPPEDLRPGLVGTLIDEAANPLDVTGTIIDLAVRGYLVIEEIPKHGWFGKSDWKLTKLKDEGELLGYERSLLDGLFRDGNEIQLSELRTKFAERMKHVQDSLYAEVVRRGWFTTRPDKVRVRWTAIGVAAFVVADGLLVAAVLWTHLALVSIPLVLGGLLLLVGARWMPRRTAKGTGLRRRILGFRRVIETADTHLARFAEEENIFYRYLPFAIVFGCTEKWAGAFASLAEPPPEATWYVSTQPFAVGGFAHAVDGFTVTTSGTLTSTPSGSGSSGFGGGGSSGGGGGGGGGGSW